MEPCGTPHTMYLHSVIGYNNSKHIPLTKSHYFIWCEALCKFLPPPPHEEVQTDLPADSTE